MKYIIKQKNRIECISRNGDYHGFFTIKNVDKAVGTYRSIKKPGDKSPAKEFKIQTETHQILEKKSKAPDWLKKKFK